MLGVTPGGMVWNIQWSHILFLFISPTPLSLLLPHTSCHGSVVTVHTIHSTLIQRDGAGHDPGSDHTHQVEAEDHTEELYASQTVPPIDLVTK